MREDELMKSLSEKFRQISVQETKKLMKRAVSSRPKSIEILQKNFSINKTHLDGFVKQFALSKKDSPRMQNEEQIKELRSIVKNLKELQIHQSPIQRPIFKNKGLLKGKNIKKQLIIQRSNLELQFIKNQENKKNTTSLQHKGLKKKQRELLPENLGKIFEKNRMKLSVRDSRPFQILQMVREKQKLKKNFSSTVYSQKRSDSSDFIEFGNEKFWRKTAEIIRKTTNNERENRCKTQQSDKRVNQKTLKQLTIFQPLQEIKAHKHLIWQLHFNVLDVKRTKSLTSK